MSLFGSSLDGLFMIPPVNQFTFLALCTFCTLLLFNLYIWTLYICILPTLHWNYCTPISLITKSLIFFRTVWVEFDQVLIEITANVSKQPWTVVTFWFNVANLWLLHSDFFLHHKLVSRAQTKTQIQKALMWLILFVLVEDPVHHIPRAAIFFWCQAQGYKHKSCYK